MDNNQKGPTNIPILNIYKNGKNPEMVHSFFVLFSSQLKSDFYCLLYSKELIH